MDTRIKNILEDLYKVDSKLKQHESELVKLITRLLAVQPDTKFDKKFVAKLRKELLQASAAKFADADKKSASLFDQLFNLKYMFNVKRLSYAAVGVAIVVLTVAVWQYVDFNNNTKLAVQPDITHLPDRAFGNLSNNANSTQQQALGAPIQEGSTDMSVTKGAASAGMGGGGGMAGNIIMPPPNMINYSFKYTGEPLSLAEDTVSVARRVHGSESARALASQMQNFNFNGIDLKHFTDLSLQNVTVAEDKDFGYMISLNFADDNITITQNWLKWPSPMDKCINKDESCYVAMQLTPADVPADNVLISIADKFLQDIGIQKNFYANPEVDRSWIGPGTVYIGDQITVIYPELIDGREVYEESGRASGLTVSIDIRNKRVSSLVGLTTQQYELSDYAAETDTSRIIKFAEQGGRYHQVYYAQAGVKNTELQLGTPSLGLVRVWQASDTSRKMPQELFVPAYIFPIVNRSQDTPLWLNSVTVPLAKELLDEADKNNNNTIQPMPVPEPLLETSQPASDTDKLCVDNCGNDVCEEVVCDAEGCPCSESVQTCPQDCQ